MPVMIWMRCEERVTEQRAPVVPQDAAALVGAGLTVVVEESAHRVFGIEEYAAVGCRVVAAGSWVDAPDDVVVLGIKELPDEPVALRHRHVYFAHAYKGQTGARALLRRFAAGGGTLLDVEYLLDETGRRLVAFGYWAGFVGAALAVLHARGRLQAPLRPMSRAELEAALAPSETDHRRALVVGALGRSGSGARDALAAAGLQATAWDLAETRQLDRAALLGHDLLVNTVLATSPGTAFVRPEDVADPSRVLSVIGDVSCDVTSACNVLPIYDEVTTWSRPVRRLHDGPPLDLLAIDNLPSLLPREASADFSAALTPLLPALADLANGAASPSAELSVWRRCRDLFVEAVGEAATRSRPEA